MEPQAHTQTQPVMHTQDGIFVRGHTQDNTFHMAPWTTDRAKVAAETEMSPPISPKHSATSQGGFVEPLQESNTGRRQADNEHSAYYTPQTRPTLASMPSSSSTLSSSSTVSASSTSSSSSIKTISAAVHPLTLHKLEIEKTDLHLLDTPPSSHASSPSLPSHPDSTQLKDLSLTHSTNTSSSIPAHTLTLPHTRKSTPQIIREISDLVDGRDKTIKLVQYFAKVFLWLFLSNPKQYALFASRLKALAKQFSTTRKVLRLGHFVDPMATVATLAVTLLGSVRSVGLTKTLQKTPSDSWRNTIRERLGHLNSVLGFCQDISDDIYCLGVIGVLDRSFGDKAEPYSNRLWMIGVSIDLQENLQCIWDVRQQIKSLQHTLQHVDGEEKTKLVAQQAKLANKLHWLQVTTVKLTGDFLFCGYDNLHCSFSDGFQAVTGFISGIAGAYKFVGKIMES